MNDKGPPSKAINMALIGFGNVGSSVYEYVAKTKDGIRKETGYEANISHVIDPDTEKTASLPPTIVREKLSDIHGVDLAIVVSTGIQSSLEAVLYFLRQQCPVVTSCRDALVANLEQVFEAAESNGVDIYFESTVGGEIPILEHIRRGFGTLGIDEIYGIVHGSTNYVLASMFDSLKGIDELAREARDKGFSPAGTRDTVEGKGTLDKMVILAGLAFGGWVDSKEVQGKGIGDIQISDVAYAKEFGCQIRHIGIAKRLEQGILIASQPMLIPNDSYLADIREEGNLIIIKGKDIGEICFQGSGAGGMSTATSVICDVIDVIRNLSQGTKKRYSYDYRPAVAASGFNQEYPFYLRVVSPDISKLENDLRKAFDQRYVAVTKTIRNQENGGGEIALLTGIVGQGLFLDIVKDFQSSRDVEFLNFLPVLLK